MVDAATIDIRDLGSIGRLLSDGRYLLPWSPFPTTRDNIIYVREMLTELKKASYESACAGYHTILNDRAIVDVFDDDPFYGPRGLPVEAGNVAVDSDGIIPDPYILSELCRHDRFLLLFHLLSRPDVLHPWLYDRCREVEANPDGYIDLWSREHYKSTIITFAGVIQEILKNPEITIGIFSFNRPVAKAFLNQIKIEFENNTRLQQLYPRILYENPKKDAPWWNQDAGIVVKRKNNPKEATIEAHGLVDSQPTSRHFGLMVYDDVVTLSSVTVEMIPKTTNAFELSRNLSAKNKALDADGSELPRRTWIVGTRYNYADTYQTMLDRKVFIPRIYPATDTGTPDGKPVFLSQKDWDNKKAESSDFIIACQMLLNPQAGSEQELKPEWIRRYEIRPRTLNVAILCDPAGVKNNTSCNTAFSVIGYDANFNKYLLDGACHKMDLSERWTMLKLLRNKWLRQPGVQVVTVGYEKYGMQADIEHFEEMMKIEKNAFPIEEVNWVRDGEQQKDVRIRRLIPDHKNWRFFYPYDGPVTKTQQRAIDNGEEFLLSRPIKRKDHEGRLYDVTDWVLKNEYVFFPNTTWKDFLDAMSRFYDLKVNPPQIIHEQDLLPEYYGEA